MKRILINLAGLLLFVQPGLWAQDAATEEKLNRINGHVEELLTAQRLQQERIAALAKELENLREQTSKPVGNFASQEDLRKLAEKLKEIDERRVSDNEKIVKEIEKISKASHARVERPRERPATETPEKPVSGGGAEKGFEYVIESGDNLSTIVQAYRLKGIKITTDQILKANPGLKPNSLKVGQKIFIPAPAQ